MRRLIGVLGLLLLLVAGCLDPQTRAQMADDAEKEPRSRCPHHQRCLRDRQRRADEGARGRPRRRSRRHRLLPAPGDYYRGVLEQYLLKSSGSRNGELSAENLQIKVKRILADPNNALVIVTGYVPAGARHGDKFDVEISLPNESKCTSLSGGYLMLSMLRVYEAAANLSSDALYKNSPKLLESNIFAHAQGALVVGMGMNADGNETKRARVWQGAHSRIDRPYVFAMKQDAASVKIANAVAERINHMYQDAPKSSNSVVSTLNTGTLSEQQKQIMLMGSMTQQLNNRQDHSGMTQEEVAKASKECVIRVRVPWCYRLEHERFLRVARMTPLFHNDPGLIRYRQRLQKMLLDPRDTVRAAIRLEALGRDSIPALKVGLTSQHPFVRFASAEALTFLGSTAGVETLAQLAPQYSILTKHCAIALANFDETMGRDKLYEMLASPDPALCCNVFNALSLHDETDRRLGGVHVNETFWLYRVPQAPTPMVYFSTSKRAQVVLLGRKIELSPATRLLVGAGKEFTIVPHEQPGKMIVKRFLRETEEVPQRVCSTQLDDVLVSLAELGATYRDVIDFLRKAHESQMVSCPVVNWSIPDVPLETLVQEGRNLR